MRLLQASREVAIPDDVTVEVKGRQVRVKGPRGMFNFIRSYIYVDTNAQGRPCLPLSFCGSAVLRR